MNPRSSIANVFVRSVLEAASAKGLDAQRLLQDSGVAADVLGDSSVRLSPDQYCRLVALASFRLNDELFGLAAEPIRPGAFGMMCLAALHSQNLREAIKRGIRYYRILSPVIGFQLREEGNEARLILNCQEDKLTNPRFVLESCFIAGMRWASWMINRHIPLERIELRFAQPDYYQEYNQIFSCACHFRATANQIVFRRSYLDSPVVQTSESLTDYLKQMPAPVLMRYRTDDSYSAQVRRKLDDASANNEAQELMGMDAVAVQLHLTSQTLRRRLREEGSSFRMIREAWLKDRATHLLIRQQRPIQDVARMLGFSEPSAFHRAFRNWTGQTPSDFIAQYHSKRRNDSA